MVMPTPEQMPLALLIMLAQREIGEGGDRPLRFLVELHNRPQRDVFDAAVRLARHDHADRRQLGIRILRELGPEQPGGGRPFTAETAPLLCERLRDEPDPRVLGWVISALGYHAVLESLPGVLALAGHSSAWVRFSVAGALPGLINPIAIEPQAASVLAGLCHDEDPEIRFYALYALVEEVNGLEPALLARVTAALRDDPDTQVRGLAADHHA
jgi:hypothetical protein